MIFDGGRDDWASAEVHDHRVGSVIAAALGLLLLGTALACAQTAAKPVWAVVIASQGENVGVRLQGLPPLLVNEVFASREGCLMALDALGSHIIGICIEGRLKE